MPFTKTNKARGRTDVAEAFDSPEHSEACRDRLASAVGCLSAWLFRRAASRYRRRGSV